MSHGSRTGRTLAWDGRTENVSLPSTLKGRHTAGATGCSRKCMYSAAEPMSQEAQVPSSCTIIL